jgi:MSHA biogenesis protein MshP
MNASTRTTGGFALMAAIFILVVLSAIAMYLLTVSTGQVAAITQDEQATRAYQAARAGVEWGAFQILRNPSGTFAATTCPAGGSTPLPGSLGTLGAPGGATFSATVSCSRTVDSEAGSALRIYVLTSNGCNRATCPNTPDATYVERQLQLVLTN